MVSATSGAVLHANEFSSLQCLVVSVVQRNIDQKVVERILTKKL